MLGSTCLLVVILGLLCRVVYHLMSESLAYETCCCYDIDVLVILLRRDIVVPNEN